MHKATESARSLAIVAAFYISRARDLYDPREMSTPPRPHHPGLAKAGHGRLVRRRRLELVAAEDGPLREMIDAADVVSEGLAKPEGGGVVYYGSTSLLLLARSRGGTLPDPEIETMALVLAHDPHLRLRALRIAQREASFRARGDIGPLRAELEVRASAAGVVVVVDVVAVVDVGAAGGASR